MYAQKDDVEASFLLKYCDLKKHGNWYVEELKQFLTPLDSNERGSDGLTDTLESINVIFLPWRTQ